MLAVPKLLLRAALLCGAAAGSGPASAAPLAATAPLAAEAAPYTFADVPAWVAPAPKPDPAAQAPVTGGSWFLLFDRQIDLQPHGDEYFTHFAIKVTNAAGVEDESEVNFSVDPSYQALLIHYVRVLRGDSVIDQRETARVTVLPVESRLEEHIYDGGLNVSMLLSDVRAGDVVEYAYTLRSRELLYPGHYSARLSTGWSQPVRWQRVRVRHAPGRDLRFRTSGPEHAGEVVHDAARGEHSWLWQDLPAIPADAERPGWFSPWPMLELGDLPDWAAVVARVEPLYRVAAEPSNQLDLALGEIDPQASPEQKLQAALRFVQREIRYTSISIGRGSHEPSAPEMVLTRRFGDCKDKSALLVAMLRRLGIEAAPALVHSERGRLLPEVLPTAYAFDHAIVRAQIGEAVYWLDGTQAEQRTPLAQLAPADFHNALVIAPGVRALEAIPRPAADASLREIHASFDLTKGLQEPAPVEIVTRFTGDVADGMRDHVSRQNPAQRQSDYVNYYARYYPTIRAAGEISVRDDPDAGVFEMREPYVLERPFADEGDGLVFSLHPDEIYRYGEKLESSVRSSPFEISFPQNVRQRITVRLPDDWSVEPEQVRVDNPAFRYASEVRYADRTLELVYEYQALADHVPVEALAQYAADRMKVDDDTGYQLTSGPDGAGEDAAPLALAPAPLLAALLSLGLGVWLALVAWREDPPARPAAPGAPVGHGGWMILPTLGATLTPVMLLIIASLVLVYLDSAKWTALPASVPEALREWAKPGVLLVLTLSGLLLPYATGNMLQLFRQRTCFPGQYAGIQWLTTAYGLAFAVVLGPMGLDETWEGWAWTAGETAAGVLLAAIWTAYMRRSQRVAATFTVRLDGTQGAAVSLEKPVTAR